MSIRIDSMCHYTAIIAGTLLLAVSTMSKFASDTAALTQRNSVWHPRVGSIGMT